MLRRSSSEPSGSQTQLMPLRLLLDPISLLLDPQVSLPNVLRSMAGHLSEGCTLFRPHSCEDPHPPAQYHYALIGSPDHLQGWLTESDLLSWIAQPGKAEPHRIGQLGPALTQVLREADYVGAHALFDHMYQQNLRWLPVVTDHNQLLGVVSREILAAQLLQTPPFTLSSPEQASREIRLQNQIRQEQALQQVVQVIRNSLDLEEIFSVAVARIADFLEAEVSIVQYIPERQCWRHLICYARGQSVPEKEELEIPDQGNPFAEQLKQLQIVRVENTATISDPINQDLAQINPGTWLLVPIAFHGIIWGSLSLARSESHPWQEQEIELAQRVSDQLAIGIQQAETYQHLQTQLRQKEAIEAALRASREFFSLAAAAMDGIIYDYDLQNGLVRRVGIYKTLGYSSQEVEDRINWWIDRIHPEDRDRVMQNRHQDIQNPGIHQRQQEYRFRHQQGHYIYLMDYAIVVRDKQGQAMRIVGHSLDISDRKHLELELKHQLDQSRLITQITQQIRQSLDLEQLLSTAVIQIRSLLDVDRVVIYQFLTEIKGAVVAESTRPSIPSILGQVIEDPCFEGKLTQSYHQGRITLIEDVNQASLEPCYIELLNRLQVRANLVVPLRPGQSLWGLLMAHQCFTPHPWSDWDPKVMQQLASQLGIAIQQSTLYSQLQTSNQELAYQVNVRNAQLRRSLDLESLLRLIIEAVRDSLDEDRILQTAVQELATGFRLLECQVTFPDLAAGSPHSISSGPKENSPIALAQTDPLERYILAELSWGHSLLYTQLHPTLSPVTILRCPIYEGGSLIASLDLIRPPEEGFTDQEIWFAEQVANQCAIGIRQARLFQASQAQIQELAKLNQLQEEFVHMVSHELRTPLTNMKMSLALLGNFDLPERATFYLDILTHECKREIILVNELLDIQAIESGRRQISIAPLEIRSWALEILEPFYERVQQRQQDLQLDLPEDAVILHTDRDLLERVMVELLNNACKYTPPQHQIRCSLRSQSVQDRLGIKLEVENTGVGIPIEELPRLFDKFYRIPQTDRWKQGGTGLGLSLVKKVVQTLGGMIRVKTQESLICFSIDLPDLKQEYTRQSRTQE